MVTKRACSFRRTKRTHKMSSREIGVRRRHETIMYFHDYIDATYVTPCAQCWPVERHHSWPNYRPIGIFCLSRHLTSQNVTNGVILKCAT